MRALPLVLLALAAPVAGGAGFAGIDGPEGPTCGEGCILLEPGEAMLTLAPAQGRAVRWVVEDAHRHPLLSGVAQGEALLVLPFHAARVVLAPA